MISGEQSSDGPPAWYSEEARAVWDAMVLNPYRPLPRYRVAFRDRTDGFGWVTDDDGTPIIELAPAVAIADGLRSDSKCIAITIERQERPGTPWVAVEDVAAPTPSPPSR